MTDSQSEPSKSRAFTREPAPDRQQSIAPVLTGFAALYLVIVVSQFIAEPSFRTSPVFFLAFITLAIFFGARYVVGKEWLSARWRESIGALFAALVLVNGFAHFYLLTGFANPRSLGLLGVGLACFFLPSKRLLIVLAVTLTAWLLLSWLIGTTQTWIHFAFGLFTAAGLRLHTDLQASRLQVALGSAEEEIAKRHQIEKALRESEERYSLAARGSKDGLWDWDMVEDKVFFSARWESMLGYAEGELGNSPDDWFRLVHPEDIERLKAALDRHLQDLSKGVECEYRIRRKDGAYRWVLARGLAVVDEEGNSYRMAGSQTDIHSRKVAEQELYHNAFHDALTGLPNRLLFVERLERALHRRSRLKSYRFAVVFLDLNRFKGINDSLGHLAGDELLTAVAHRLKMTVRTNDTVARFGGDEFAILLDDLKDDSDARVFSSRLHDSFKKPFGIDGREVFVNASLGIVLGTESYENPGDLIRDADTAMYRAKAKGDGSTQIFDQEMHQHAVTSWRLENELRAGLRHQQFLLVYQPIVSLTTGQVAGCEALLRWRHPDRGLLSPSDFQWVAQEAGLIVPIGWWVLEEACKQVERWERTVLHDRSFAVSINLVGAQFAKSELVDRIEMNLGRRSLSAQRLTLEISENDLRQNERAAETLQLLSDRGLAVHLDDFGRVPSSLSFLHRMKLSAAKIDRAFFAELGREESGKEVVRAMVNLIHDLGMKVIVEGVEDAEQMNQSCQLGCEFAQGHYIGQPMDGTAFEQVLQSQGHLDPSWTSTMRPN